MLRSFFILSVLVFSQFFLVVTAQDFIEPEIQNMDTPQTPLDFGLKNGATFTVGITNNGFAVGGQYRRVVAPMTELMLELQISALKDSREQTFFNVFGQQIIPNKYNRVLTFPLMFGARHRILADAVSDNFRIYLQGMMGPALTFTYPYFRDVPFITEIFPEAEMPDGLPMGARVDDSQINDMFQGWSDGEWVLGFTGKAAVNIDFGSTFNSLTSLEFGVQFFHYPDGIQILEPNSITFSPTTGRVLDREIGGGFSAQKWSVTPTITLMFGGMW